MCLSRPARSLTLPAISLVQLHYFVAAIDHASFSGAARQFNVKQTTLSRRIQALEHQLGIELFERTTTGARPTDAGKTLVESARRIIDQVDGLADCAARMRAGHDNTLRIGFCALLASGQLKHLFGDFLSYAAQCSIVYEEAAPDRLVAELCGGRIDAAIMPPNRNAGDLQSRPLWSERLLAAIPNTHPLVQRKRIYWQDICDQQLILSTRGLGTVLQSLLAARSHDLKNAPEICLHDISHEAVLSLAATGTCISLTTEASLGLTVPNLVHREIAEPGGIARIDYRLYWHSRSAKPALASLIALINGRYPA